MSDTTTGTAEKSKTSKPDAATAVDEKKKTDDPVLVAQIVNARAAAVCAAAFVSKPISSGIPTAEEAVHTTTAAASKLNLSSYSDVLLTSVGDAIRVQMERGYYRLNLNLRFADSHRLGWGGKDANDDGEVESSVYVQWGEYTSNVTDLLEKKLKELSNDTYRYTVEQSNGQIIIRWI